MSTKLHFAENALALHLFLERFEGLVDVVVADENLHVVSFSIGAVDWADCAAKHPWSARYISHLHDFGRLGPILTTDKVSTPNHGVYTDQTILKIHRMARNPCHSALAWSSKPP
jgi:hypothetical protein